MNLTLEKLKKNKVLIIGGIILVALAGVLFYFYKKKQNESKSLEGNDLDIKKLN